MNGMHSTAQVVLFALSLLLRVWGIYGLPIAKWIVRTWVRGYTRLTTPDVREDRRQELASDLAEQISALRAEGYHPSQVGARILFRMLAGIGADLMWACQHLSFVDRLTHSVWWFQMLALMVRVTTPPSRLLLDARQFERHPSNPASKMLVGLLRLVLCGYTMFLVMVVTTGREIRFRQAKLMHAQLAIVEQKLARGNLWPDDKQALQQYASHLRMRLRGLHGSPELPKLPNL